MCFEQCLKNIAKVGVFAYQNIVVLSDGAKRWVTLQLRCLCAFLLMFQLIFLLCPLRHQFIFKKNKLNVLSLWLVSANISLTIFFTQRRFRLGYLFTTKALQPVRAVCFASVWLLYVCPLVYPSVQLVISVLSTKIECY